MEDFFRDVWKMIVESNVLNLVWAILVLLIGWIVAVIVSGQAALLVTRLGFDKKINRCLPQGSELAEASASKFIGRFVYYLILLLAILGCLTALKLTQAAEPIKDFVGSLTAYAAKIIGAVALAFIAWVVATVLRYGANTLMKMLRFDERFAKYVDGKNGETSLSETVSAILYWVVLLFFLPSILNVLEIKGITEPIQQMFTRILGYIPNLIAAAAILFVGLIAAKIVRKAVTGLIMISGIDALGEKAGVSKLFGDKGLSSMIGIVAYVLVAIPVVISSLTALKIDSLSNSVAGFFDKLLNATGDILGAALLIFVAFLAGSFVSGLVTQIFENFGFNQLLAKLGFTSKEEKDSSLPSVVVGKLTFLTIIFMAAVAASDILNFTELSRLLRTFMEFGGNIIVGVIVLLIGIWVANFAASAIRGKCNDVVVMVVRIAVLIFTGAIAIHNMNIGGPIVQTAFTLLLGAVCVAIALAFGLGGRDFAARKLDEWTRKTDKKD
ncbi:MAG: mechanosensitive ion channel [Victivallales bacterium]|jgi:conserved TM helix repeat-containing protein